MQTLIAQIEFWGEHGLMGLVIFALFGLVMLLVKLWRESQNRVLEVSTQQTEKMISVVERNASAMNGVEGAVNSLNTTVDRNTQFLAQMDRRGGGRE